MNIPALIQANPLIGGLLGSTVLGAGLVYLRSIPTKLCSLFVEQFSVRVEFTEGDPEIELLEFWLSRHPYTQKARRLGAANAYHITRRALLQRPDGSIRLSNDEDDEDGYFQLAPGNGAHLIWYNRTPFLYTRSTENNGSANGARRKRIVALSTLGRSQKPLRDLLTSASAVHKQDDITAIYLWDNSNYRSVGRRATRSMDTIFLDPSIKSGMVDDARWFIDSEGWYHQRGIPYRRGYLLEGPPGTGKSSFIFALAGLLKRPVYIVNAATLRDDNTLQSAFNEAAGGILVMEDIDAVKIGSGRQKEKADEDGDTMYMPGDGITLSGLLNAIDGIGAGEGRILFFTSNFPDRLDHALMRPGRVDVRKRLELMQEAQALEMFQAFYPGEDANGFLKSIRPHLPISAATLQGHLLQGSDLPGLLHIVASNE